MRRMGRCLLRLWVRCCLLLFVGILSFGDVVLSASPAHANCNAQQAIFTYGFNGYFGAQVGSGAAGTMRKIQNHLDSCGSYGIGDVNTVHMLFNDARAYYYEAGFWETYVSNPDETPHHMTAFVEEHIDSNTLLFTQYDGVNGHPPPPCSNLVADDSYTDFMVATDGAGSWTAYINCYNGGGFGGWRVLPTVSAFAQTGVPRGEFERFSDQNGFANDQLNLRFRDPNNPNGAWYPWKQVLCWGDTIPGAGPEALGPDTW